MAKLASLRQDAQRISDGDWITVGFTPEGQFRIRTRGQTPRYLSRVNQLQREAAREANRGLNPGAQPYRPDDLPAHLANRCFGLAMAEETFLDVRDLDGEDGPVTAGEFRDFLMQPEEYGALIMLAYGAMLKVHEARQSEAEAAAGNSAPVSAGS